MAKPIQPSTPITGKAARALLKAFETPPSAARVRRMSQAAVKYLDEVRRPKAEAMPPGWFGGIKPAAPKRATGPRTRRSGRR